MNIKRFFAPDMRRAIHLVRSEHGPDAVILSSQSVDGGVEIIAAGEYDENLIAHIGASRAEPERPQAENRPDAPEAPHASEGRELSVGRETSEVREAPEARTASPAAAQPRIAGSEPELRILHDELRALKGILRDQFARLSWSDLPGADPRRTALIHRLEALGLDTLIAEMLVKEVDHPDRPDAAWRDLVFGLAKRIKVLREDPLDAGGVFALVGPTGVGKTTTIAKLAARHCLRYGRDSLALITTDNYRIGGHRQLDAYGAILGVPVRRADGGEELASLLNELADRRLVLIDTAGMAPRDERVALAMQQLSAASNVRRFLVLAANMQQSVMSEAARRFGNGKLAGVILTKLDEATGLGAALSLLIKARLPVAWLSDGQRVPEDLKLARIAHMIKGIADPNGEDAEEMIAEVEQ
jgi:flagellar biosynthesis protein FlhF